MIDTIKVRIPLTKIDYDKLRKKFNQDDSWQWVKHQPSTGEMQLTKLKGLIDIDLNSYHRNIYWDISPTFIENDTYLSIELSLPKFWYGHNIWLKYSFLEVLEELQKILENNLSIELISCDSWEVYRVDICYAWKCPNQGIAKELLNQLKGFNFPRKKPIIYDNSIMFVGQTYSFKFYLKYPEFIDHDRKDFLKQDVPLEWINYLEQEAHGVLRCEATLRKQWLNKNEITYTADLLNEFTTYNYDQEIKNNYPDIEINNSYLQLAAACIFKYHHPDIEVSFDESIGRVTTNKVLQLLYGNSKFYAPKCDVVINSQLVHFKGGGFISESTSDVVEILNNFITKILGGVKGMDDLDTVREKLSATYKNTVAARLVGFWVTFQRVGEQRAKEIYGKDSFYRFKRQFKEAGVSLIESDKIVNAADRFRNNFKFNVPSGYVVNSLDKPRDIRELIKFPSPKSNEPNLDSQESS